MKIINLIITLALLIPGIIKSQIGVGPAPYCMPIYFSQPCNQPNPSNTPGNSVNDFIHSYNTSGATFNIVNNASGCNAQNLSGIKNYRLWGCQYYMICSPGQVINSNFQSGITYAQGCTVFVDWNNNGVYNLPGERMTSTAGVPPAGVMTAMPSWVVPNVPAGVYRMRVRCAYSTTGGTIDPCLSYGFGETEEYFIYVNTTPNTMTVNLTSNSPVCIGGLVQINTSVTPGPNSGTCTANTYTYNWTGPMNYTSNVMSPSFTATNVLQSGVYTLNITPPNGCGCASTNTIQIWVNPNPSTSITNNGPLCKGSLLNFSNTITGSGAMTYNWTGPNGFVANTPSLSFASAQPTNTGVYNFTVVSTFTNGGFCLSTSSSSAAVVSVTQVSVVSSYTQCQGTNINLVATPNSANSYSWSGPNSYTSNLSNPVLNGVTPNNSGNYTVTAYYTSNQTTLVCSSSAVSNVSIVPMSPITVSTPTNICQGTSIVLTASATSNPTYNWTGPNNLNTQQQSLTFNNTQPFVSGIYSVTAVWSIGQVSCQVSGQTQLGVVPVPSITVVPQITVCEGQSAQLTSTAQGALSYTWTGPNGFNVTQPITQFQNLTGLFSGQYTVTALFTNGNLNCYKTNTTDLLVSPIINFSLTPIGKLCYGQTLNVSGPGGATSYTWTGPGFGSNSQNLFISSISTNNIGTYNLTVDLNGCKTFGSIYVDVQDPIYWKSNMPDKTLCKGETFTLTPNVGGGSGNYAFIWNPSINNLTGPYQTGVAMGTTYYNVSVYDISCPTWTINQSMLLTVNSAGQPSLSLQSDKCEPFCQLFDSKLSNTNLVSYSINNQNYMGDSVNICLPSGEYTISTTVIGKNGCREVFNYPNKIVVNKKPDAWFNWSPDNINTVSDNKVTFNHLYPKDVINWSWQIDTDTTQIKSPVYTFEKQGTYPVSLLVTNKWGCKDTVIRVVKVQDEFLFWIPDVFTPNGDGVNDLFKPKCIGIKSYDMFVFDRWGNQIYYGNEQSKGWDGLYKGIICQDGVYVYYINAIDNNLIRHNKTDHITLLK
jgi:gliding motility-associated-like protein